MEIFVNERIHLTEIRSSDKSALVELLSDWEVYRRTLRIPHPYTEADADRWLSALAAKPELGSTNWAIRDVDERLLGGICLERAQGTDAHRAELGYWLGQAYWGRGVMTEAAGAVCRHGFETLGLAKITAGVLVDNAASARVLTKNGFEREGLLRAHHAKDGRLVDIVVFGRLM